MNAAQRRKLSRARKHLQKEKLSPQLASKTLLARSARKHFLKNRLRKTHKNFWIFLGSVATLGTLIGFYISLYPFISIDANEATSTKSFQDTKFLITNNSPLPIYNVWYYAECWDGDMPDNTNEKNKFAFLGIDPNKKLGAHSIMSARVQFPTGINPDTNRFVNPLLIKRPIYQFYVRFSPWWSWFVPYQEISFGRRFWAYKGQDGKYIWNPAGEAQRFKATDSWPKLTAPH